MKKKRVLKNYISYILYFISTSLVLLNIMLLAELNSCYLFYSISLNIIFINHYILKNFSSKKFYNKYISILDDEI